MSVSGVRVRSEGQLRALMAEASAVVLPALNEWLRGAELNGVTQIASLCTLKPFVLSVASQWESCSSLSQFTVILHWIFGSALLCERCPGFVHPVRNLRLQWLRSNRKNQFSVFSGEIKLICCPSAFFIRAVRQCIMALLRSRTWRIFIIHAGQVETAGKC